MISEIGLIGVGVMGSNLALLFAEHKLHVRIVDPDYQAVQSTLAQARDISHAKMTPHKALAELVRSMSSPRVLLLSTSHGPTIDMILGELRALVSPGDCVVDCGNEWFEETERRQKEFASTGAYWMGMGVSGGWKAARHGPSCTIAGDERGWRLLQPTLEKVVASSKDGTKALGYFGDKGQGHYVKMVHNGIEQAMMSALTEVYGLTKCVGKVEPQALSDAMWEWNKGELQSFLLEISAQIVVTLDPRVDTQQQQQQPQQSSTQPQQQAGSLLLSDVQDRVTQDDDGSEGTGVWTVKQGPEQHVSAPSISNALFFRLQSAWQKSRASAAHAYAATHGGSNGSETALHLPVPAQQELLDNCRDALIAAYVLAFAQGMAIISAARTRYKWQFSISDCLRAWTSGCIIQARVVDDLIAAFDERDDMRVCLESERIQQLLSKQRYTALRRVVLLGVSHAQPVPSMAAAISYFDAFLSEDLPTNFMQAQLDYFGVHKFYRKSTGELDHVDWEAQYNKQQKSK